MNNIFNYESFDHYKSETLITGQGKLVGTERACHFVEDGEKTMFKESQNIASISLEDDDMFIFKFEENKAQPKDLDFRPWLVVKHTEFNNSHV